jgi:hypothetical protein
MTESRGKTLEVRRFVKPGASLEVISNTERENISQLTKKDVIVVWEGTNDIRRNASRNSLKTYHKFYEE